MWQHIDNYNALSRNPFCSITGLPKAPDDSGVFRLADIEFEGCFDVSEQVIRDMAAEINMVDGKVIAALEERLAENREAEKLLQEQVDTLEDTVERLNIENAHLRVGIEEIEKLIEEEVSA
jgi:hypothetical protein